MQYLALRLNEPLYTYMPAGFHSAAHTGSFCTHSNSMCVHHVIGYTTMNTVHYHSFRWRNNNIY